MGKDVIVACDFDSAEKTFEFLDKFTEKKPFIKIGMELFSRRPGNSQRYKEERP